MGLAVHHHPHQSWEDRGLTYLAVLLGLAIAALVIRKVGGWMGGRAWGRDCVAQSKASGCAAHSSKHGKAVMCHFAWRLPCALVLRPTCLPVYAALQVLVAFTFHSDDLYTFHNHVEGVEL